MKTVGDFAHFAALADLPRLVRTQRRLEARIAPLTPLVEQEQAIRKDIDALLVTANIQASEAVTCLGYDVSHNERKGQRRINEDRLVAQLVTHGLAPTLVLEIISASTDTADPSSYATVKPSKGSKVRP